MDKHEEIKQSYFDLIAGHLLEQGRPAVNERGEPVFMEPCDHSEANACVCAYGFVIRHSGLLDRADMMGLVHHSDGDGRIVDMTRKAIEARLRDAEVYNPNAKATRIVEMVEDLRVVHDRIPAEKWPEALLGVAGDHRVNPNVSSPGRAIA